MLSYSVCMCLANRFYPCFDSVTVINSFLISDFSNGICLHVKPWPGMGLCWSKFTPPLEISELKEWYVRVILCVCRGVKSFCFFRFLFLFFFFFGKKKISLIFWSYNSNPPGFKIFMRIGFNHYLSRWFESVKKSKSRWMSWSIFLLTVRLRWASFATTTL